MDHQVRKVPVKNDLHRLFAPLAIERTMHDAFKFLGDDEQSYHVVSYPTAIDVKVPVEPAPDENEDIEECSY